MDIKLNFINASNDQKNSRVVIFQKNASSNFDEMPVAWTVVQNCGAGDNHPFTFPMTMQASAVDSYGNYTPSIDVNAGEAFQVTPSQSGDTISRSGMSIDPTEIQVTNKLAQGAISACIYKNGKLLARKTHIAPLQMATFQFKPTIWVGAVAQVAEGEVMSWAVISQANTELSLLGIASAEIVMKGGGSDVTPITFTLENVVRG